MSRFRGTFASFAALTCALLAVKWPTLRDPPYWDAQFYLSQAHFVAQHGLDIAGWRELWVVKPPLYTHLLGFFGWLLGMRPVVLHVVTVLVGSLALPGAFAVVRGLGGSRRAGWIAVALLGTAPLFFAQCGLLLSDLPETVLIVWAWAALLHRRTVAFAILAGLAVLTKESGYFLAAPAALLLFSRNGFSPKRLAPSLVPALALLGWLLVLRAAKGEAIPAVNRDAFSLGYEKDALIHSFVEGGRIPLVLLSLAAVIFAFRDRSDERKAIACSFAAVIALPLLLPAPLPRYMLPSLPLLCALAALALDRLRLALPAAGLLAIAQVAAWWCPTSYHSNGGHHRDANLLYRRVLAAEIDAARALADAHATRVLAPFPTWAVLAGDRADGWPTPLVTASAPTGNEPRAELCQHDFLVDAEQSNSVAPAMAALGKSISLWGRFGASDVEVRVYKISCD
jgi:4-amino-4-deoxy-L-arabinose transferase-like glycosyltransferase